MKENGAAQCEPEKENKNPPLCVNHQERMNGDSQLAEKTSPVNNETSNNITEKESTTSPLIKMKEEKEISLNDSPSITNKISNNDITDMDVDNLKDEPRDETAMLNNIDDDLKNVIKDETGDNEKEEKPDLVNGVSEGADTDKRVLQSAEIDKILGNVDTDKKGVLENANTDKKGVVEGVDADNTDNDDASIIDDDSNKLERINEQHEQIKLLKDQLVTEEITLCLYRKILESQRNKGVYKSNSRQMMSNTHMKQPQVIPKNPSLHKPQTTQPVKSQTTNQPSQKYYIQVGNQLVPAPPPSSSNSMYQYTNGVNTSSQSSSNYQSPKPAPPVKQTPEQKQNAAKAVLRRQLEQTLLQIPPPHPPPADWKVIPNVNSMDFMMLVGLDEVVDCILDNDKKPTLKSALEALMPYNPRICAQCQVDFSPCWKNKEGNPKEYVVCERCASQNIKKDLKAEHTARLKSAFLKALKQEQEIEEKIKAGEEVNIGNLASSEKENQEIPSPKPRLSSPLTVNNHSPVERHSSQHSHHRQHQVVQHYPQHTSLVQQLHHQHIQQQQMELEPPSRHSSRWHPYKQPSSSQVNNHHSHREHTSSHHRSYVATPDSGSPMQEYYVVHHPQHANVRYISR